MFVFRNTTEFFMLILHPTNVLNLSTTFLLLTVFVWPLGTLVHIRFMSIGKCESQNPYLVPDVGEKAFIVSSWRLILVMDFSHTTFIGQRILLSIC